MRQIKFRAWDKEEKSYVWSIQIQQWGNPYEGIKVMYPDSIEEKDLEQFTGLLDRNGKEIYEGDTLNHRGVRHGSGEVVWFELDCAWGLRYMDGVDVLLSEITRVEKIRRGDGACMKLEVIGNIHENPDLLTP